jgi:hypothetical protein
LKKRKKNQAVNHDSCHRAKLNLDKYLLHGVSLNTTKNVFIYYMYIIYHVLYTMYYYMFRPVIFRPSSGIYTSLEGFKSRWWDLIHLYGEYVKILIILNTTGMSHLKITIWIFRCVRNITKATISFYKSVCPSVPPFVRMEQLRERDHLEDPGVVGRMLLR